MYTEKNKYIKFLVSMEHIFTYLYRTYSVYKCKYWEILKSKIKSSVEHENKFIKGVNDII